MANIEDLAFGIVVTPPSPATSGTSVTVGAGEGLTFPSVFPFYATLVPPGNYTTKATSEIVRVDSKSTDTFTIVRAQKGTLAKSITAGWIMVNAIYKDDIFSSSLTIGETLTGTPNGVLTTFTTSVPFTSIAVYKNGVRMRSGGSNDYTATGSTVTFVTAPSTGAVITADYIAGSSLMVSGSNNLVAKEAPVETPNSSLTTFTVAKGSYVGGSLEVFINGLRQGLPHVTETNPAIGTFTLDAAPPTGANLEVAYQYAASVTGNADTVDNIHANTTATANQLYPLNASSIFPAAVLGAAWTSWTPTFTNLTVGSGVHGSRWTQIGKIVFFQMKFTLGAGSSVGSTPYFTLPPVAARSSVYTQYDVIGHMGAVDISATGVFQGVCLYRDTTTAFPFGYAVSGSNVSVSGLSSTAPFTWATGDVIHCQGFYEAA